MLARQLCVFDDKTDSKSKWVKKLIIWLYCSVYLTYFVKNSTCDTLLQFNGDYAKWMSHALTQGIRTINFHQV